MQTQGAVLNVWAMGIVSMPVKAQTEARLALNVAKMAIKGRNAVRRSPSASFARPERSTILERETAPKSLEASVIGNDSGSPRENESSPES